MLTLIEVVFGLLVDLFRSRAALEAEILVLRQQIIVLRRRKPARLPFMSTDKLMLGWVCRVFPNARDALAIVRPKTVVRWHRAGDCVYSAAFIRCVRAMGIRDRPTAPQSPWQNGYAERLIGSIRRDCLDHVVVFGERHLRHLLGSYLNYYNDARTHLSLNKDAPASRAVQLLATSCQTRTSEVCTINTSGFDLR